ncbi:MAG TPA: NlpC/P60 family protein [Candidatus Paceibacterota bacterium]
MTDPTPPIQPKTPPGSKTLIYSPQIRIVIASGGKEIDVSRDVLRGRVIRAVDAVSQAEFYLNNKNGKYTGVLRRMDKVVIWMKRITWIQVFTGYLDIVPAYDLFPTEAYIRASCTLKRIKYTYWDKGLTESQILLNPVTIGSDGTHAIANNSPDTGTGIIIHDLLTKVGGWPANQVLIQQIPTKFMDFMANNIKLVDQQEVFNRIYTYLQGGGIANGQIYPWTSAAGETPVPNGEGGRYTQNQIISLVKGVWGSISSGVSQDKVELGAAYIMKVSGGDPNYGKDSRPRSGQPQRMGLFALDHNGATGKTKTTDQLLDPLENIRQAWIASNQGTNWSYWSNTLDLGSPPSTLASVHQDAPNVAAWVSGVNLSNSGTNLSKDVIQDLFSRFYGATSNEQIKTVLDFAAQQIGKPYVFGATGPDSWDCSGLTLGAYKTIGIDLPHFAEAQAKKTFDYRVPKGNGVSWTVDDLQPGDLIFFPGMPSQQGGGGDGVPAIGHIGMYVGNGQMIEAGDPVQYNPVSNSLDGTNGPSYTANFITRPISMLYALSDSTESWKVNNENGGVNAAYRLFNIIFKPEVSGLSLLLRDDFAPANDESLLTSVSQVSSGSMRSFMSGPNGDFIAFFPDYFGINETQAVWDIEDVEIIDLKLQINDDELVTHVYTVGDTNMNGSVDIGDWIASSGEVSIKSKAIMEQVLAMQSNTGFLADPIAFMQRYGMRPMTNQLSIIRSHYYEFFSSLYTFLQQWSKQFSTVVQICFMPELFPGMRIKLAKHDVCVYVESLVHVFDFEEGFQTYPTISCPSTPSGGVEGLPIAMGI